jgi:glycosyltransferase involved in cell wall biosynthesis
MQLTIAVPCYNEAEVLPATIETLVRIIGELVAKGKIDPSSKAVFIDDGSSDHTWQIIERAARENDNRVGGLKLSAPCGHQQAMLAGLMSLPGDAIITIDADLQDDPAAIEQMVDARWAGAEIVFGVRRSRGQDSWSERSSAQGYYRLLGLLGVRARYNHADFRLMGRQALEALRDFGEVNIFLRGLVDSLGFRTDTVYYDRKKRAAGDSKYPLSKKLSLAVEGIASFSAVPLHVVTYLGLFVFLVSLALSGWVSWIAIFTDRAIPGWVYPALPMYLLAGIQLLSLGVIGEYVGKIFLETKRRPRYIVEKHV